MNKLTKLLALAAGVAGMTLLATGCDDDGGSSKGYPYNHVQVNKFAQGIKYNEEHGQQYVVIDGRPEENYDKWHIPGSVWIGEATLWNCEKASDPWPQKLKELYPTSTNVFIVGNWGDERQTLVPSAVSEAGYGKDNTFFLSGGIGSWYQAYLQDSTTYPLERDKQHKLPASEIVPSVAK